MSAGPIAGISAGISGGISADLSAEISGVLGDVLDRVDASIDPGRAWTALAEAGLLGLAVPEEYGGEGLGPAAFAVLVREAARRAAPLPVAETLVAGLAPLLAVASALRDPATSGPVAQVGSRIASDVVSQVVGEVIARVVAGEQLLVPALAEPGDALPPAPATRLRDGAFIGRKVGVPVLHGPTLLVVSATGPDGPVVGLVDPAGPGVTAVRTPSSTNRAEATYVLDGAPALALLGRPDVPGGPDAAAILRRHVAAAQLLRLDGLLAGALAMTARHIGERQQFGRRLAEFQAVAQQIADVYVVARLTAIGVAEVVRRLEAGEPVEDDLALLGLWCCDRILPALQTCHHLHGGVGVDETYPLAAYTSGALDAVRHLGGLATLEAAPITEVEGKNAELSAEQRAFKQTVRSYFAGLMTHADQEELLTDRHGPAYHRIIKQMGADGYLGVGWPVEYGGKGLDATFQAIFANEAARADVHLPAVTLQTVGPTLQEFGTAKQKQMFLPRILTGELHFAIGYSEPDAGTDLASLRTTARRVSSGSAAEDYYLVNGQKLWTTGAHAADYIWLAARTDPTAPRHRGISILIVDTRDPGFSWTPIRTIDGSHHVNATSFDDVRVPVDMLVGEENGGWKLITTQLNHERVMLGPAGRLEGLRDLVLDWAADRSTGEGRPLLDVPAVRAVLARTTAAFRVNELLNWQVASRPAAGGQAVADASACKVFASTEVQRLGLDLLGIVSTYGDPGDPDTAWLLRLLDATLKRNLVLTFGGGVNEVQRELIAQFGLGLPRVPR